MTRKVVGVPCAFFVRRFKELSSSSAVAKTVSIYYKRSRTVHHKLQVLRALSSMEQTAEGWQKHHSPLTCPTMSACNSISKDDTSAVIVGAGSVVCVVHSAEIKEADRVILFSHVTESDPEIYADALCFPQRIGRIVVMSSSFVVSSVDVVEFGISCVCCFLQFQGRHLIASFSSTLPV
jgi:hypothetical protein